MNQVEPFSGEEEILQHDSHDNMYDENSEEIKQEAHTREGEHSTDRNIEDSSLYGKDDDRLEPPTLDKFVPEQPPVEEAKEESKAEEGKGEAKKDPKENSRKFVPQALKSIEEHKKAMRESQQLLMMAIGTELRGVKYDYISFYDLAIIRSHDKDTTLMLGKMDSKLCWTNNLYQSSDYNITPVIKLSAERMIDNYHLLKEHKIDPLSDNRYEKNIKRLASDLANYEKVKQFPVNINQPFFFKGRKAVSSKYKIPVYGEKEEKEVQEWFLIQKSRTNHSQYAKPDRGYHLVTFINNKFYYLGRDPDSNLAILWTDKNGFGCTIEIGIYCNSIYDYNTRSETQRLIVADTDPVYILDNKSRVVSHAEQHVQDYAKAAEDHNFSGIVATEYDSYKDLSPKLWFNTTHYKRQAKQFLGGHINVYSGYGEEFSRKVLRYDPENNVIQFSCYRFYFTVIPDESGRLLKTNSKFRLQMPDTELYARSQPQPRSGISKIVVSKFDERHQEEFNFYFGRPTIHMNFTNAHDNSLLSSVFKWENNENLKEFEYFEELSELYIKIKENLCEILHTQCNKDPNVHKQESKTLMCINGWLDIDKLRICSNAHNFEKIVKILKEMKKCYNNHEIEKSETENYYYNCLEYVMLMGCSESEFNRSSVLKKAVGVITDAKELPNNDYRRIMMLQKIVLDSYDIHRPPNSKHKEYIYELKCFMPFIRYELDKGIKEANLVKLIGLMTNSYRDEHCVMNRKVINIAVTEYYVSSIVHKEISFLHSIDLNTLKDAWEEVEDEIEDLYFEGRRAAFVQNKMQNTVLRDLTLLYTYSIGVREGVVQDCAKKELLDDLREQYLYFYNNLFIQGTALKILCNYRRDQSEVKVVLLKAITDLKEIERFDNVPAARYACEVTGVLTDFLEDPEMSHIAKDLLTHNLLKFLYTIIRDISKRRRLSKPAAFDFAKYTHYDNPLLRAANEAMVDDTFDEVDVVLESYHKELAMNLQNDSLITIKEVICKWLNFEHEPELSSRIFDTILSIDYEESRTNANEAFTEDDYSKKEIEEPILDLCSKTLPFFIHLNVVDLPNVKLLEKKVQKLKSIFKEESDLMQEPGGFNIREEEKKSCSKDKQEKLYYDYIYTIYNLILLLVKVNQLYNIREESEKEAVQNLHLFISTVYQCIIEACKYSIFAKEICWFNFDFLSLGWKNKNCNELHYVLLRIVIEKSTSRKLNLDFCDKARNIFSKLDPVIPDEEFRYGHCEGKEKEVNQVIYGASINYYGSLEKMLKFFVGLCNKEKIEISSDYFEEKRSRERETTRLDLASIQVDDSSLASWCGMNDRNSKVVNSFKYEFLEIMKEKNCTQIKLRGTREFQIFIYKLLETLNKIQISYETQKYTLHTLKMLYQMVKSEELMRNEEIKEMFYTELAFTSIFSLIIRKYDYIKFAQRSRQFAYLLLLGIFRLDIKSARKSFKIWSNQSNNRVSLFTRIQDLSKEFFIYFGDSNLCETPEIFDINDTDYKELILTIKWMELFSKNNKKWQNYLSDQRNMIPSYNIVSPMLDLMCGSLSKTHHNYVVDLMFVIVRFIIENINGNNKERIREYADIRIFTYFNQILKIRLERNNNKLISNGLDKNLEDSFSDTEDISNLLDAVILGLRNNREYRFKSNCSFEILVQNILTMINIMITPETSHMFINEENKELINELMKLNYLEFYNFQNDRYLLDLFKKNSNLAKKYNIKVGFE